MDRMIEIATFGKAVEAEGFAAARKNHNHCALDFSEAFAHSTVRQMRITTANSKVKIRHTKMLS